VIQHYKICTQVTKTIGEPPAENPCSILSLKTFALLFTYNLFNAAFNISDYIASNERMIVNNELERMWKEAVVAKFMVLSRHLPGGTKENHEKPQSGQPVSGPRIEHGTSRIRSRSANHSTTTFGFYACSYHTKWKAASGRIHHITSHHMFNKVLLHHCSYVASHSKVNKTTLLCDVACKIHC
jgi:hypothetical protein